MPDDIKRHADYARQKLPTGSRFVKTVFDEKEVRSTYRLPDGSLMDVYSEHPKKGVAQKPELSRVQQMMQADIAREEAKLSPVQRLVSQDIRRTQQQQATFAGQISQGEVPEGSKLVNVTNVGTETIYNYIPPTATEQRVPPKKAPPPPTQKQKDTFKGALEAGDITAPKNAQLVAVNRTPEGNREYVYTSPDRKQWNKLLGIEVHPIIAQDIVTVGKWLEFEKMPEGVDLVSPKGFVESSKLFAKQFIPGVWLQDVKDMPPSAIAINAVIDLAIVLPFLHSALKGARPPKGVKTSTASNISKMQSNVSSSSINRINNIKKVVGNKYGQDIAADVDKVIKSQQGYVDALNKYDSAKKSGVKLLEASDNLDIAQTKLSNSARKLSDNILDKDIIGFDSPEIKRLIQNLPEDILRNTRNVNETFGQSIIKPTGSINELLRDLKGKQARLKTEQTLYPNNPSRWSGLMYDVAVAETKVEIARLGDIQGFQNRLVELRSQLGTADATQAIRLRQEIGIIERAIDAGVDASAVKLQKGTITLDVGQRPSSITTIRPAPAPAPAKPTITRPRPAPAPEKPRIPDVDPFDLPIVWPEKPPVKPAPVKPKPEPPKPTPKKPTPKPTPKKPQPFKPKPKKPLVKPKKPLVKPKPPLIPKKEPFITPKKYPFVDPSPIPKPKQNPFAWPDPLLDPKTKPTPKEKPSKEPRRQDEPKKTPAPKPTVTTVTNPFEWPRPIGDPFVAPKPDTKPKDQPQEQPKEQPQEQPHLDPRLEPRTDPKTDPALQPKPEPKLQPKPEPKPTPQVTRIKQLDRPIKTGKKKRIYIPFLDGDGKKKLEQRKLTQEQIAGIITYKKGLFYVITYPPYTRNETIYIAGKRSTQRSAVTTGATPSITKQAGIMRMNIGGTTAKQVKPRITFTKTGSNKRKKQTRPSKPSNPSASVLRF